MMMERHPRTGEATNKLVQAWIGSDHIARPFKLFRLFVYFICLLLAGLITINSYFLISLYSELNNFTTWVIGVTGFLAFWGYFLAFYSADLAYIKFFQVKRERLIVQLFKQWFWEAIVLGMTNFLVFLFIYHFLGPNVTAFFSVLKVGVLLTIFYQILIPGFITLAIFLQYLYRSKQEDGYKIFVLMISIIVLYLVIGINYFSVNIDFQNSGDVISQLFRVLNNLGAVVIALISYFWLLRWVTDH